MLLPLADFFLNSNELLVLSSSVKVSRSSSEDSPPPFSRVSASEALMAAAGEEEEIRETLPQLANQITNPFEPLRPSPGYSQISSSSSGAP